MNKRELNILIILKNNRFINQRDLATRTHYSLGLINRSLKALKDAGYIDSKAMLTEKAYSELAQSSPKNAIILAAGFGMRMVPINHSAPKALLEVRGEPLIERLIHQLHEAGILDITVVTGFMKESFEYLIDDYGVDLVVNKDYASKNNLHSLALAADRISNTYIIPCDIWCAYNPFSTDEPYSWYMVSSELDHESPVRINRKSELTAVKNNQPGNKMIGICYLHNPEAEKLRSRLKTLDSDGRHDSCFWEEALTENGKMYVSAKSVKPEDVVEINTFEQLRDFDSDSNQLKSDAIEVISEALDVPSEEITGITVLKKGMTNRSFLFTANGKKYIMRIPGEGTDQLISRENEAAVYQAIHGLGLCDDPVYINPVNGYKITAFLENVRICDPDSVDDLNRCMKRLKNFHRMKLAVPHTFDIFGQIEFYETLWQGAPSIYRDYRKTKENVFALKTFVDQIDKDWCLTHIDAVPDNFLFHRIDSESEEALQLTDWEYAGMQDPHVDIAMFIIYSLYNKQQADRLIDIYFENACPKETRAKIYCYIAMCGLLWSNWCEFKSKLGIEFGEYSLRQYRYAKDYYKYARELMETKSE